MILWSSISEVITLSPRTGRPKADNPKNYDIKVRYDEETHKELIEYCKKHNIKRVEAFRQGLKLLLSQK